MSPGGLGELPDNESTLDDIPSFGDPERESQADREYEARIRERLLEADSHVDMAWVNYRAAQGTLAADKARRMSVEAVASAPQAQSSVQIEDAAKGDPRVSTKWYVGSPLTRADLDAALDAHAYAHRTAAALAMRNWELTVLQMRGLDG